MAKIFISHSSKQKQFVDKVVNEIGKDDCFVDIYDFRPSEKIKDEINRHIDSCDIFAVFLSHDAWTSDWVKYELGYVRDHIDQNKVIFRPFIIEDDFSISDITNMVWIKSYIINIIPKPIIIARSLSYDIRQLKTKEFPYLIRKEKLFIGRDEDMASVISKYYERAGTRALFISGIPLIGRKRFAKEVMLRVSQDSINNFVSIEMQRDESIDVFLLKLNDIVELFSPKDALCLASNSTEIKIKKETSIRLLNMLYEYKQKLLIVDDGCIVQQGGYVVDWFKDVIKTSQLESYLGVFVCSRYSLRRHEEEQLPVLSHRLSPVSDRGIETLAKAYSKDRLVSQDEDTIKSIVRGVEGSPRFVYDAIDCLKDYGKNQLKEKLSEIAERKRNIVSTILDDTFGDEHNDRFQLLLLLSKFDNMSYGLLEKLTQISGLATLVEEFKSMSIIEEYGSCKEYFRLHPVIIDYVRRLKKKLTPENEFILQSKAREILANMNTDTIDLSQQLFGIKRWIMSGGKKKNEMDQYFIPSITLKVIIEAYNIKDYSSVIDLSDRLLEHANNNYQHLLRSIKYWLCCALCRKQDNRFFQELPYFDGTAAYHFLLGFYYRISGNYDRAEIEYQKVINMNNSYEDAYLRAKEELVLVKIKKGHYNEALQLAEENYNHRPYNPYFIVSYFRCLVKNRNATRRELVRLINELEKVSDPYGYVNSSTMNAELTFYSDHNFSAAVETLKVVLKSKPKIDYPQNALREICKKNDALRLYDNIIAEVGISSKEYDSE